ncbi:MAG: SlyX family protein [Phreatobacter sp.]|uniref:SlyX family protein n=1 Tax=Phreatobacter sp. TaxID=1966341 RepID=UPI004035722E
MSDNDLGSRFDALEIKVAYQDQAIEDLNATITAQWKELERLGRLVARLEDQLREAQGAGPQGPEPPPPHY